MQQVLAGQSALITGASQGLGKAIAEAFIAAGANIVLCARDQAMLDETGKELAKKAATNQQVLTYPCDVSDPIQVHKLCTAACDALGTISILVNSAGIYGPKGEISTLDWVEWTRTIEVNLYGTVLTTRELLPQMIEKRYGKIINLSGGGATSPMPRFSAYAASKAAVVRFSETLAEEVREYHIDVNAIAPGALNTRLLDEILDAGSEKVGLRFYEQAQKQKKEGGVPLEKGAMLTVFLASSQSDGITGKLISAVWDPWEELVKFREQLAQSDIFTLRRIVPRDRGLDW